MLLLIQKYIKIRFATQSMHQSENIKIKLITIINKDEYSWLILLYARANESLYIIVENPNSAATILNHDLNRIDTWAPQWLVA